MPVFHSDRFGPRKQVPLRKQHKEFGVQMRGSLHSYSLSERMLPECCFWSHLKSRKLSKWCVLQASIKRRVLTDETWEARCKKWSLHWIPMNSKELAYCWALNIYPPPPPPTPQKVTFWNSTSCPAVIVLEVKVWGRSFGCCKCGLFHKRDNLLKLWSFHNSWSFQSHRDLLALSIQGYIKIQINTVVCNPEEGTRPWACWCLPFNL